MSLSFKIHCFNKYFDKGYGRYTVYKWLIDLFWYENVIKSVEEDKFSGILRIFNSMEGLQNVELESKGSCVGCIDLLFPCLVILGNHLRSFCMAITKKRAISGVFIGDIVLVSSLCVSPVGNWIFFVNLRMEVVFGFGLVAALAVAAALSFHAHSPHH